MNICIVAFQYPPLFNGNVASMIYRISKGMANVGINIHVFTVGPHRIGMPMTSTWEEGIQVHRTFSPDSRGPGDPIFLKALGDYMSHVHQEVNFDLIHGFSLIPEGWLGARVARSCNLPFVISLCTDEDDLTCYNPVLTCEVRRILEQAVTVTSWTESTLENVGLVGNISDGRVVLSAFNPDLFSPWPLRECVADQTTPVRLFVERFLRAKKGHLVIGASGIITPVTEFALLIEAFQELLRVHPKSYLLLLGDFEDQNEKQIWVNQIKKKKLKRQIFITGDAPIRQHQAWLREMDIFVLPHLHESSPNSLLEAMGCGLPIVASNVGKMSNLIRDEEDGLLVLPGRVDDLAEKLIRLSQEEELRHRLGASAKRTVESRFSQDQEIEVWLEIYEHATGEVGFMKKHLFF